LGSIHNTTSSQLGLGEYPNTVPFVYQYRTISNTTYTLSTDLVVFYTYILVRTTYILYCTYYSSMTGPGTVLCTSTYAYVHQYHVHTINGFSSILYVYTSTYYVLYCTYYSSMTGTGTVLCTSTYAYVHSYCTYYTVLVQ
jgi:hypothetical protein